MDQVYLLPQYRLVNSFYPYFVPMRHVHFFLLSFLLLPGKGFAQGAYRADSLYGTEALKQDLHVLHETLTEADPALYRYRTKKQVDSMFATLAGGITRPMTEDAFKKNIVLPAVVYLRDLHFVVYPSQAAERYLDTAANYFPFDIKTENGRMYIWRNMSANAAIGTKQLTEIVKINGVAAGDILKKLQQYIVADGESIATKRMRDIEESFRTYYGIAYGRPGSYTLEVKYPGNKTATLKVPAAKWHTIQELKATRYPAAPEPPRLAFTGDSRTAILTLRSFDPRTLGITDDRLERFIDSAFGAIYGSKAQNLVLDLRGNYGGRMNYGGKVYSYLTSAPYKYIDRVEVCFPHMFASLIYTSLGRSYLSNTYGMRLDTVVNGDSIYIWDTYQWTFEQQPAKNPFTGRLYVLADGYTFSTTGILCSMIRGYRDNTAFVGEETGGAYEGCSGNLPLLTLPHTGLRVYFPIRKFVSPARNRPERNKGFTARGILPDVEVRTPLPQQMAGEDAVLKKALELSTQ